MRLVALIEKNPVFGWIGSGLSAYGTWIATMIPPVPANLKDWLVILGIIVTIIGGMFTAAIQIRSLYRKLRKSE